jgi:hypothetical protein
MRQKLAAWVRVWLWGALLAAGVAIPFAHAQQPFDLSLPSGTIAHFDLAACPTGWTEFTSARGAYIVGLTNGGTPNTLVGTALTNQENRPAGSHNHGITEPNGGLGHVHGGIPTFSTQAGFDSSSTFEINDSLGASTSSATTGITINAGGGGTSGQTGVAGTNGPYLQLLVCSKN